MYSQWWSPHCHEPVYVTAIWQPAFCTPQNFHAGPPRSFTVSAKDLHTPQARGHRPGYFLVFLQLPFFFPIIPGLSHSDLKKTQTSSSVYHRSHPSQLQRTTTSRPERFGGIDLGSTLCVVCWQRRHDKRSVITTKYCKNILIVTLWHHRHFRRAGLADSQLTDLDRLTGAKHYPSVLSVEVAAPILRRLP